MPKILAVAMVKDEADIITASILNMLVQVDYMLVADNLSSDATLEMLRTLESRRNNIKIVQDEEVGYYQSRKMSDLAATAAQIWGEGDDWIVPFDADEVWTGIHQLRTLPSTVRVVAVQGWDYRPTSKTELRMDWRESLPASFLPKVAFRYETGAVIAQGNHGVSLPGGTYEVARDPVIRISHFPIRSVEQFIRKVRNGAKAYDATNLSPWFGDHWRRWGSKTEAELEAEFLERFWSSEPERDGLTYDPVFLSWE